MLLFPLVRRQHFHARAGRPGTSARRPDPKPPAGHPSLPWRSFLFTATLLVAILDPRVAVRAGPIDPGDVLVVNQFSGIVLVDPATGAQTAVSPGGLLVQPLGIALAPNGDILVADPLVGVIRVNPGTGGQTVLSSGGRFVLSGPRSVTVAPSGEIYVVDEKGASGGGEVIRINPVTGAQTLISSGGSFVNAVDLALTASGEILVVDQNAFGGSGGVIRINPETGAQTILSSGGSFIEPFGIAIGPTGDIFVTDPNAAAIFQINPLTGAQSTVGSGGLLGGGLRGIGIEANGDLLVAIRETNQLVRVNPLTGSQIVLSSGGLFGNPNEIAIAPVPEPATLLLLGSGLAGLGSAAWRRTRQSSRRKPGSF